MFGKIHIIEWLRKGDRRTGAECLKDLRPILATLPITIPVILHRVSSRAAFLMRLRRIEEDFRLTGRLPLLQIETHGDDDGIGKSDDDGITWAEMVTALTPLNQTTGLKLTVILAACHGMWGIKMAQPMERAPFFALIGPNRKVEPGEVVRGMRAFYQKAIVDRDGFNALEFMNNVTSQDAPTFRAFNCEQLFRMVWDSYLEDASDEDRVTERVERIVEKAKAVRPRNDAEVAHLRSYGRNYLLDHQARFEESRRKFFMIDLHPENAERFALALTPVGGLSGISCVRR